VAFREPHGIPPERHGVIDWAMLIGGTVLGILSLTADLLGIGGFPGFGWRQAVGTAVAILLVAGATVRIIRRERGEPR
jgi:hypothetical protein